MKRHPPLTLVCDACGGEFRRRASYHRHLVEKRGITAKFCSRACKEDAQRVSLPDGLPARYATGETVAAIALSLDVSAEHVRHHLIAAGVTLRSRVAHMSGDRNPTKGKGHSEAAKAKIRAANARQFSDPEARERAAHNQRRAMSLGLIPASSKLEDTVAGVLDSLGIEYKRQYLVRENGRYCACLDFMLDDGTALEVNGSYWHCDPRVYPDGPTKASQLRTAAQYAKKQSALARQNIPLREVWELDIQRDPVAAVRAALD